MTHFDETVPNDHGAIKKKYEETGGSAGTLGEIVVDNAPNPDSKGRRLECKNGLITWSAQSGARVLLNPIGQKWFELMQKSSWMLPRYPTMDMGNTVDGIGRFVHFERGSIYWHPNVGVHEIHGGIRDKWAALHWEQGFLGYPVTDETTTPDGVGRFNHFQGGSIYWHPDTGAYEVHGAIREKWRELGWERGFLGYPTTDETTTPDGAGRFNHFQGGSIYFHPNEAHEVHGAIRNLWATLGWEKSYLGYPTTDELATPGPMRCQRFQNGSILWTPDLGAREVPGVPTRYLIGVDKFHIDCTRAVHEDTDHVKLAVRVGNNILLDLPVKHMGDVNNGDHMVGLYCEPPLEIPTLDTMVTFNYLIENIGSADNSAIENGLKAGANAGLSAAGVPGADAIVEIGGALYHLFAANCDGPVAVDQIAASGHLLNAWTADCRVYSEDRNYTYQSQTFCGDSPRYRVTWSVVRL